MVAVPKKYLLDEIAGQPDRVEYLRAAIGLIGRDAHLRHDLQKALVDRLDEALDDFVGAYLLGQILGHSRQGLEREIGIDRLGAVTGQTCKMMHFARFASLDHEAHRSAQALADQVMMHRRGREQRRDRDAIRTDHAIGEDDYVVPAVHCSLCALAKTIERLVHAAGAACRRHK